MEQRPDIRRLIGEARLEDAIDQLAAHLESKRTDYPDAYRSAIHIQADFRELEKERIAGTLSNEQLNLGRNRIQSRLLDVLDQMEQPPAATLLSPSRRWPVILAMVLGLAGILYFILRPEPREAGGCPSFAAESAFNILVHPFTAFESSNYEPHAAIVSRLDRLNTEYQIGTSVQPLTGALAPVFQSQDAERLAGECGAQLVIWGNTESLNGNGHILQTFYQFFHQGEDRFRMTKVNWEGKAKGVGLQSAQAKLGSSGFIQDTVQNLSEIVASGKLTRKIEETILLLFGVVAHQTRHEKAAIASLSGISWQDSASQVLGNMVLADSYLETDKTTALRYYDKVLQTHPDYPLALNNRAYLELEQGQAEKALQDINRKLRQDSSDAQAWIARSEALLDLKKVRLAEESLEKARSVAPEKEAVRLRLDEVDREIELQKRSLDTREDIRQ